MKNNPDCKNCGSVPNGPDRELVNFLTNDHSYGELYSIAISYFNQKTDNNSRRPIVYRYPKYKDINYSLKKLIVDNATIVVQGGGRRTETKSYDCTDPDEINVLFTWIINLIPDIIDHFSFGGKSLSPNIKDINSYKIVDYWGVHYSKGEGAVAHNHFPYTFSFAYYISTPDGCSSLDMEEESFDVQEGELIVWLSNIFHKVRPSDVDGRVMISGNISYLPTLDKVENLCYK